MATLFDARAFGPLSRRLFITFRTPRMTSLPAGQPTDDPIGVACQKFGTHNSSQSQPSWAPYRSFPAWIASGVLLNLATRDGGYLSWCVQTISPPQPSTWTTLRGDQRGASSSIIPVASLCPRARHCVLTPVPTPLSQLTVARFMMKYITRRASLSRVSATVREIFDLGIRQHFGKSQC